MAVMKPIPRSHAAMRPFFSTECIVLPRFAQFCRSIFLPLAGWQRGNDRGVRHPWQKSFRPPALISEPIILRDCPDMPSFCYTAKSGSEWTHPARAGGGVLPNCRQIAIGLFRSTME
jgi:hypothetical protein